jgi:hypothetical protein
MPADALLSAADPAPKAGQLRPPETVMRLSRMGAFHQSRLSFMRVLLRRLKREGWRFERPIWRLDDKGVGVATYAAIGPERTYTLICYSHDLPPDKRSDRVIAEAWDATFTLFDGVPEEADIERLSHQVPLQEAGRISERELVLSRANRSVRMFDYVVDCLAEGGQPEESEIEPVGYLMRTTAVYGSGKFGAADRDLWKDRPEFRGSFQPELLSVYLIRSFTLDLVEHLARARAPETAVTLDPELRRTFGVGNSTGLGMAPFLISHPALIHSWIAARETALARVRAVERAGAGDGERLRTYLIRAARNAASWTSAHPLQQPRIEALRADLQAALARLDEAGTDAPYPWDGLYRWAEENLSLEGQEQVVSLLLELYPELVDPLAETMSAEEEAQFRIDGAMTLGRLRELLREIYAWALDIDYGTETAVARVWYVSVEKLEPRLGERFEEPLDPYEQPLAPGRDAAALDAELDAWEAGAKVAAFLAAHPEHRHIVRRIQVAAHCPYAEIHDNTVDAGMLPIDLLRCKLSFFGATRFDPRSDRWVRITMYQQAPFPEELAVVDPDELAYPPLRSVP